MAKILLADDNSNVHKTVALALAALGIEVNSVNNGDAAIKKLEEFSPDLVLADIFMPVRSGYEVCEYVKKNSRFAHIPVVLLVGAFDPLDEREAQRVGADGILKKPFVPPDPLITMVKTLLHRIMGERLAEMAASKEPVPVLAVAGRASSGEAYTSAAPESRQSSGQEFQSPVGRVEFADTRLPAAFSQLLEAARQPSTAEVSANHSVENEQVITSSRDAILGEPIFWKNDSPEEESQEESPLESTAEVETPAWTHEDDSNLKTVENEPVPPVEPLEFVSEEQDQTSPSIVDSEPLQLDLAAQTPLTVEPSPAEDLAANPIEWLATAPSEQVETEPVEIESLQTESVETAALPEETEAVPVLETATAETDVVPVETATAETDSVPVGLAPATDMGLEALKLAATNPLDHPDAVEMQAAQSPTPSNQAAEEQTHVSEQAAAPPSAHTQQSPDDTLPSVSAQQWTDLTASISERANELASRPTWSKTEEVAQVLSAGLNGATSAAPISAKTASPDPSPATALSSETNEATRANDSSVIVADPPHASEPDPALVEAVVQKVISKMSPQVVDIITREFLRPIVQALVHRAIEK